MPMTMSGEVTLPAARPRVWAMLNDASVLKLSIPGCQSLEKTSDTTFAAVVKVKIGPVGASFKGKVQLSDIDSPNGYTISGEGEGGIAGFANGGARVMLLEALSGTILKYDVQANVGGKIAQLGSRLIDGVAKKMADQFFANFASAVGGPGSPASAGAATETGSAASATAAAEFEFSRERRRDGRAGLRRKRDGRAGAGFLRQRDGCGRVEFRRERRRGGRAGLRRKRDGRPGAGLLRKRGDRHRAGPLGRPVGLTCTIPLDNLD